MNFYDFLCALLLPSPQLQTRIYDSPCLDIHVDARAIYKFSSTSFIFGVLRGDREG